MKIFVNKYKNDWSSSAEIYRNLNSWEFNTAYGAPKELRKLIHYDASQPLVKNSSWLEKKNSFSLIFLTLKLRKRY